MVWVGPEPRWLTGWQSTVPCDGLLPGLSARAARLSCAAPPRPTGVHASSVQAGMHKPACASPPCEQPRLHHRPRMLRVCGGMPQVPRHRAARRGHHLPRELQQPAGRQPAQCTCPRHPPPPCGKCSPASVTASVHSLLKTTGRPSQSRKKPRLGGKKAPGQGARARLSAHRLRSTSTPCCLSQVAPAQNGSTSCRAREGRVMLAWWCKAAGGGLEGSSAAAQRHGRSNMHCAMLCATAQRGSPLAGATGVRKCTRAGPTYLRDAHRGGQTGAP